MRTMNCGWTENHLAFRQVDQFFDEFTLRLADNFLESMFEAACSGEFWKYQVPGNLLHFMRALQNLVSAAFRLKEVREDPDVIRIMPYNRIPDLQFSGDYMREGLFAQAWNALPRNLSTVAFHDPYKAIRNFCRYKNEQDWIFILAALTELALGKDTLQESFPTENPFAIRKKLLGVVEASHLIWVRKLTRLEAS